MNKLSTIFIFTLIIGWSDVSHSGELLPDEPEAERDLSVHSQTVKSYNQALDIWKTAEDLKKWVSMSFVYGKARAIELSSDQREKNKGVSIYNPSELFGTNAAVCVDLARFGVETLKIIEPNRVQNI
jgi:hypothetical protein